LLLYLYTDWQTFFNVNDKYVYVLNNFNKCSISCNSIIVLNKIEIIIESQLLKHINYLISNINNNKA